MRPIPLHSFRGNRPDGAFRVHFAPPGGARLAGARGGEDEKFQREADGGARAACAHRRSFLFGGAYRDFGDGAAPANTEQDYTGWALNASYSFGPYGVELQYAHAERDRTGAKVHYSEFDGWAAAVGYSLAPGLKWYAEVVGNTNNVRGNLVGTEDPDGEYSSTVFLSGLLLSF